MRRDRLVTYLLLLGAFLTVRGYQSRDGDQAYRLPLLLHRQDPAAFADDPFVRALDAFNPHGGYLALLDLASRPLGLSLALFALFAITFGLTCLGVDRLARSVNPAAGGSVGPVAVVLVLLAKGGNIGTNHLFEAILLDRLVGFALGWVAIALAVEGETWRPSLLVGLATVIHPSVGLQLGGLIGAGWVAWSVAGRASWRATGLGLASLSLAIVPGALPALSQGRRLFEGLSPGEFRLLGVELQMAQHMVPSLWRRPQWLAWGATIAVGLLSLIGPIKDARRARFAILLGVLLAGLGVATAMIEVVGDLRVTVFQPFRMATIARGLALVAAAGRVVGLWRRGDHFARSRVLLLLAGLGGDWTLVVAVAVEFAASLGESIASQINRPILGTLPATTVLGLGLIFLTRHDTEAGQIPLLIAVAGSVGLGLVARRVRDGLPSGSPPCKGGVGGGVFLFTGRLPLIPPLQGGKLERPRINPGAGGRRLALAALACWALPGAAFVVEAAGMPDPLGLARRCRFLAVPTDEVERLAAWSASQTPADARFVTPPGPKTFRLWSGRSVAFNRAASPYHAEGLKDWSARFRAHVGFEGTTREFVRAYLADRHGVEAGYDRLTPEGLARLASGQGAGYVLARANLAVGPDGPLRLLKADGRFAVYRVDAPTTAGRGRGAIAR